MTRIDDMDHPLDAFDVGGNDVSVVDHGLAIDDGERYGRALQRAGFESSASHYLAIDHVVEQDERSMLLGRPATRQCLRADCANASSVGAKTVSGPSPLQHPSSDQRPERRPPGYWLPAVTSGINIITSHFGFGRGFGFERLVCSTGRW